MAVESRLSLGAYLREISKIPMVSREEEIPSGKLALKGDQKPSRAVEANLRFVVRSPTASRAPAPRCWT
jgi:RNA polymerase primary sigma factor